MKKSSRWEKGSFLLLVISVCLSALLAEGILRTLGYGGEPLSKIENIRLVEDPILDWRYQSNAESYRGKIVYHYNHAGFRDVDHTLEKPPGTTRIVVLGDSVTEGYGVEWSQTFPRQLQTQIGDRCEVITIAQQGINTLQEVDLFKREGLQYHPDLVILNFILNDAEAPTEFGTIQEAQAHGDSYVRLLGGVSITPALKRTLKYSALVFLVKEEAENLHEMWWGPEDDYYSRAWGVPENRQQIITGFQQLAALQREGGFTVVVLIWPLLTEYQSYHFAGLHQWTTEQAKQVGFSVLDLLPEFAKVPYRNLQVVGEDSVHPNALGHQIAVNAFLRWRQSSHVG